jgi:predicted metalloprotease
MAVRQPSRLLSLAPVVAALVALACVAAPRDGSDAGPAAPTRTATGPAGAGGSVNADGTQTVAEFRRDVGGASDIAEQYWKAQFAGSGRTFRPVTKIVAYGAAEPVACGAEEIGRNNAAYCPDGDFIAYDEAWALGAFRQIGDAFIFYLFGHEYAHAIQLRLGIRKRFTIQQELQADCMSGALLGDSVRAEQLDLADGDLDEFRDGLLAVGDDPSQPWFAEGSHGTARQRTRSFTEGYDDSLDACGLS